MNFSKEVGFFVFRIILPIVVLLIQFVLYKRATRWSRESFRDSQSMQLAVKIPFYIFNAAFFVVLIFRPRLLDPPEWFKILGIYPFFLWFSATFFIGFVLFVSALIRFPFRLALFASKRFAATRERIEAVMSRNSYQQFNASRRVFLRRSVYGLTAVSFAGNAYGLILEKGSHDLTAATFEIPNLPASLDGFAIALISDIHSSVFMTREDMDVYVQLVNSMNPDLIAVPGDFVNSMTEEVYPFAEAFSNLRAPYGIFGVMGNHDFYAPRPDIVANEVDACGVKMLRNDRVTIEKRGAKLCILGVDDTGRHSQAALEMDTALRNISPDTPKVLLCHRPYFLPEAAERKINLVLSGHTHGGQIVLGQIGNVRIAPASLASKYVWGKYRIRNTHMYVSRGIGTVGLPVRINCPPEITKIILKRA